VKNELLLIVAFRSAKRTSAPHDSHSPTRTAGQIIYQSQDDGPWPISVCFVLSSSIRSQSVDALTPAGGPQTGRLESHRQPRQQPAFPAPNLVHGCCADPRLSKSHSMPDFPQRPFFIRILVPTGDSDGLRIVEKSNWPGVGVVFNRTNYKEVVNRTEFGKTGVYVLIGTSDDSILPVIYVGEGDPVRNRLNQHHGKKDFWNWAVFFVAKDDSLNKAHVQHLESELLRLAKEAKQCRLDNSQEPLPPTLSEADTVFVESFLQDIVSIFPLLGLGVFEKTVTTTKTPSELLYIESKGIRATGFEDARGFVVVKGSQVVKDEVQSIHQNISNLRKDLLDQGVIVNNGQTLTFAQDQVFGSPSTAAAVILGRSANGRTEWRNSDGKTLKQLQLAVTDDAEE